MLFPYTISCYIRVLRKVEGNGFMKKIKCAREQNFKSQAGIRSKYIL